MKTARAARFGLTKETPDEVQVKLAKRATKFGLDKSATNTLTKEKVVLSAEQIAEAEAQKVVLFFPAIGMISTLFYPDLYSPPPRSICIDSRCRRNEGQGLAQQMRQRMRSTPQINDCSCHCVRTLIQMWIGRGSERRRTTDLLRRASLQ